MRTETIHNLTLINTDCMEYMKGCKDNEFDLAIVDPPYNIASQQKRGVGSRIDPTGKMNTWNHKTRDPEYFLELFRVSRNQVTWGANNYVLPPTEYFCIWNKKQTVDNFATAEYAWVSMGLKTPAKVFDYSIHQHNSDHAGGYKIHPTQKPIPLYDWLLTNYAEKGQKILDTHGGSFSSAIAAHYFGCEYVGIEIDKDYFEAGVVRVKEQTKQIDLFRQG